MTHSCQILIQM